MPCLHSSSGLFYSGPRIQAVSVQTASRACGFLLHLALCKLGLGQDQVSMQPDLGSCNFPPAELTHLRPHSRNTLKGSTARPASLQRLCPLQATFIEGREQLGWGRTRAALCVHTSVSLHVSTGFGAEGGARGRRGQGASPGSDGGCQLPLGALAATVKDEVCAGPRGYRWLRLRALGLRLLFCRQTTGPVTPPRPDPGPHTLQPRPRPAALWPRPRGTHASGSLGSAAPAAPGGGAAAGSGRCCAGRCPG